MAFMAKLKDEVTGLRQQLKARDGELTAAYEASGHLKADLSDATHRVAEQQERIESLQDQLELAQHRTPQAQLISMHMAGPSRSISHLTELSLHTGRGGLLPASSGGLGGLLGQELLGSAGPVNTALEELQQPIVVMWQQLNVSWLHR
jgi:hypothetical protein